MNEATKKQLDKVWHTTNIYLHPKIHEYAERLVATLRGDLKVRTVYTMHLIIYSVLDTITYRAFLKPAFRTCILSIRVRKPMVSMKLLDVLIFIKKMYQLITISCIMTFSDLAMMMAR